MLSIQRIRPNVTIRIYLPWLSSFSIRPLAFFLLGLIGVFFEWIYFWTTSSKPFLKLCKNHQNALALVILLMILNEFIIKWIFSVCQHNIEFLVGFYPLDICQHTRYSYQWYEPTIDWNCQIESYTENSSFYWKCSKFFSNIQLIGIFGQIKPFNYRYYFICLLFGLVELL